MRLTIKERFLLRMIIPDKGSLVTGLILRRLHDMLAFDDKTVYRWNIVDTPVGPSWGRDRKDPTKKLPGADTVCWNFDFSNAATEIICDALKGLEAEKKLPYECLSLWAKFFKTDRLIDEAAVSVGAEELGDVSSIVTQGEPGRNGSTHPEPVKEIPESLRR